MHTPSSTPFVDAALITRMHDEATALWHTTLPDLAPDPASLLHQVRAHHRANYDLWHQEDEARNPSATDSIIATVKHAIDRLNQLRNDTVEQMDVRLLAEASPQNEDAPLHSETPGLIIDRLSILALKQYHTAEESQRPSATEQHRLRNLARLHVIRQQRNDLALCLDQLWNDIRSGRRRFKLYRQMKMYNDPDLNPVLYRNPR
ncbi:DUF4254 domain-containing protein [Granulicella tundricola]|uniref:DUF4254 domain-containing protein n=1 Tax=Granulicella tundricola (strain ATCC BAA-1859 / DSM 23138 / MP5ACTX9) TaxID=1198114 RepID=E8X1U1_GRATM|nr:DUF4254 domain-containing protein [Granulicella tundricola]ADW69102.1 hypothetical protein AciX9_2057 [Granulicella tundricola MP5ACTX9]